MADLCVKHTFETPFHEVYTAQIHPSNISKTIQLTSLWFFALFLKGLKSSSQTEHLSSKCLCEYLDSDLKLIQHFSLYQCAEY